MNVKYIIKTYVKEDLKGMFLLSAKNCRHRYHECQWNWKNKNRKIARFFFLFF